MASTIPPKVFKSLLAITLATTLCPITPAMAEEGDLSAEQPPTEQESPKAIDETASDGNLQTINEASNEGTPTAEEPANPELDSNADDYAAEQTPQVTQAETQIEETIPSVALSDNASDSPIVDWTTSGTCEWMIDAEGALTVRPANGAESGELGSTPWTKYASSITSATFVRNVQCGGSIDFRNCLKLQSVNLSGLDTSNTVTLWGMFKGCSSLESVNLSGLDTSAIWNMQEMFYGCSSLKSLDLSGLDVSNLQSTNSMFYDCSSLQTITLSEYDTPKINDASCMFTHCSSLKSLDLAGFSAPKAKDLSFMFQGCTSLESLNLSNFNTSCAQDTTCMFSSCSSLRALDLSGLDMRYVTNMLEMFSGCSSLKSLDLPSLHPIWSVSMNSAFKNCSALEFLDLSKFANCTLAYSAFDMFYNCSSLKSLDLSELDTSRVEMLSSMFEGCSSLESLDLSGIDLSKTKYASSAFKNCSALRSLDLSAFEKANIQTADSMFEGCSSLESLDLSGIDTSSMREMGSMLNGCSSISKIKLGQSFSFFNNYTSCKLPIPMKDGEIGKWIDQSTGVVYEPETAQSGKDVTYHALWGTANLRSDMFSVEVFNSIYTGEQKTGSVQSSCLIEHKDYEIVYLNNINAGTAKLLIVGKGNYSGTLEYPFSIEKAKPSYQVPEALTAQFNQTLSDIKLPEGFCWQDDPSTTVGQMGNRTFLSTYTPTDTNYYSVSDIPITVKVIPAKITDSLFSVDESDATYTGSPIKKFIASSSLTEGVDYAVSYENNTSVGLASIVITGRGCYSGTLTYSFKIVKATPRYTPPEPFESAYNTKLGDLDLPEGFSWQDDPTTPVGEPGEHTFLTTFTPDDTVNYNMVRDIPVTVRVTCSIDASMFSLSQDSYTYNGSAHVPNVVSAVVPEGSYSVQFRDNSDAGQATAVVSGSGFYTGTCELHFTIAKADPAYEAPSRVEAAYGQTLGELALPEGFSWQGDPSTPVGEPGERTLLATFTPDDTANYNIVRDVPVTVRVTRQVDASMFSLSQSTFTYDGSAHEPAVSSDVVPEGSYSVEYHDNANAGEGIAAIIGSGFYTGTCELHFTIAKADPGYEAPSSLTGVYGETLGSIALPEGFSWQDGADAMIDWYGTKALRLVFTPADAANYNSVRDIPVEVYVQRGSVEAPAVVPLTYTGDLQKPLLGGDPRITVIANEGGIDAGSYTATVALADPAFDKWADGTVSPKTVEWSILPADLSAVDFDGPADAVLSNGKAEPAVTATFNGRDLVKGRDFAVSYEGNASYGDARATVKGLGNFTGERSFGFRIGKADISTYQPMIYDKVVPYKGEPAEPRVYLLGDKNGMTLHEGIDYEVEYADNDAVGTAKTILRGIGDYVGSVEATFDVVDKIDVSSSAVTFRVDPGAFYTGEPIAQPVSYANLNGRRSLVEGVDYTISYTNNVKPGQATAIIRGIGDFAGETRLQFSIIRKGDYDLSSAGSITLTGDPFAYGNNTFLYSGSPVEPNVSVWLKIGSTSMRLTESVDYTVSYSGNDSVGSAYATVTGINGLAGKLSKSFQIANTLPVSSLGLSSMYSLDQIDYGLKDGSPAKPKLLPYPGFVEGADYELSYKNCDKIGTGTVTVTGRGRYTGSIDLPVRIVDSRSRLLLYDCAVGAIPDQVYTGGPIEPSVTVRDANGKVLDPGLEYSASYFDNVNAGEASVLVANGAGFTSYDGYLRTSFNILPADIADCEISDIEDQPLGADRPEPDPEITFNGQRLQKGVDYDTSYSENDRIGIATCTITGKGNFTGEIKKSFKVVNLVIPYDYVLEEGAAQTFTWNAGSETTFQLTLPNGGAPAFLARKIYGSGSPTATVIDSQGRSVYTFGLETAQYGSMALPAGTYYIRVNGGSYGGGETSLHYWNVPYGYIDGATYEKENNAPNDKQPLSDAATPVNANGRFIGTGYAPAGVSGSDVDYFAITLDEPSGLELDFTAVQSFEFDLVDENGETITSGGGDGYLSKMTFWGTEATVHMNCGRLDTGTYYVKVVPQTRDSIGAVYYCDVSASPIARIAGNEAADTSARIAQAAFPEGSDWVVVARDDDFADAMSATGLAGALDAPIVLTGRYELSGAAAEAVKKLGAKHAYIVGGTGAIPGDLESELAAVGCSVEKRVFGEEAYDTSVECAKLIQETGGGADYAVVAYGQNFQDALSMSSFAYRYKCPIFLQTYGDTSAQRELPAAARKMLTGEGAYAKAKVFVAGGAGAVSEASAEGALGAGRVVRLAGEDGFDTSNQIARYMVKNGLLSASTVCVANGAPAPKGTDALAGAALAGRAGGVMLLANANAACGDVSEATIKGADSKGDAAFLSEHASEVSDAYVLGGSYVMPEDFRAEINGILK